MWNPILKDLNVSLLTIFNLCVSVCGGGVGVWGGEGVLIFFYITGAVYSHFVYFYFHLLPLHLLLLFFKK